MNIIRFIKEKKYSTLCSIFVLIFINIYLISLNSFNNDLGDLLYLDFIIVLIYVIFLWCSYNKYAEKYKEIYNLTVEDKNVLLGDIKGNTLEEEMIYNIIKNKDDLYNENLRLNEEKLRDMEEYISKWVHEIKLPISALNIILERIDDDEISNSIKNEVEKINFLVNGVMYGSRSTASAEDIFIKEENIQNIVRQCIKNNAFFLIKNNIEISLESLNYDVYTDKKWMLYVLDQIVNNSIKYMKNDGKLEFYAQDNPDYIELCIKDNGIGIAPEDIERIFNKGFTGSNGRNTVYKSTGMGLYFTKKIMDKLEHKIEVESVQGEYTVIKIRFYKISDYLNVAVK